jgi:hypothetical protein
VNHLAEAVAHQHTSVGLRLPGMGNVGDPVLQQVAGTSLGVDHLNRPPSEAGEEEVLLDLFDPARDRIDRW